MGVAEGIRLEVDRDGIVGQFEFLLEEAFGVEQMPAEDFAGRQVLVAFHPLVAVIPNVPRARAPLH